VSKLLPRFFLHISLALCSVAQQGTILHVRGHITDATTRRDVAGVTVGAVNARHSATTDVNGFFSVELRDGTRLGDDVRIHIEMEGYRADDVTEAASENVIYAIRISPLGKPPGRVRPPSPHPPAPRTDQEEVIQTLTVEARMTCTIKEGEELPPSTQDIVAGFGTGSLVGAGGTVELARTNPVEFRKQRNNEMVVVNHFYLPNSESLVGNPISRILNFDKLIVPITILGNGQLFDRIRLVEVTVTINNRHPWYYPYKIGNVPFEGGGPTVTIPLAGIDKVLHSAQTRPDEPSVTLDDTNRSPAVPAQTVGPEKPAKPIPPVTKTQDQVEAPGSPTSIIPQDPVKAVEAVSRMRKSLTAVIGKKDTITFLITWPNDDNSNLVFVSNLISQACRDSPRQCWFTQEGNLQDLDKPPVQASGRPGITVHGPDAYALANALGAWFTTHSTSTFPPELNGYNEYGTKEIMWIEIGPGSPWKAPAK
jgi:hypothetical protein